MRSSLPPKPQTPNHPPLAASHSPPLAASQIPPALLLLLLAALLGGCTWPKPEPRPGYRTVATDPRRNTDAARELNRQAASLLKSGDLTTAEATLKSALKRDLFFGPAHSNLGTVYLKQKRYYLAAWEYQYAAKLMPNRPEPKNNLGLVFESVGRLDESQQHYEQAHELEPDNPEYLANLTRARLRAGLKDAKTRDLLQQIVMKDTRPQWTAWAQAQLSRLPKPLAAPSDISPPQASPSPKDAQTGDGHPEASRPANPRPPED